MNTFKSLVHFSIGCAVLILVPSYAIAVDITFGFSGIVTAVDPSLTAEFSVGEQVLGSYTFDSTTPDSDPDVTVGEYTNAVSDFSATFGGDYTVTEGANNVISVGDDAPNDAYTVLLTDPVAPTVAGLDLAVLAIGLIDTSATVFNSDALPLTPPDISGFDFDSSFSLYFNPSGLNQSVDFQMTSLTLIIPEPTALALAVPCLLGIVSRRRTLA